MMTRTLAIALAAMAPSLSAHAADTGARTYGDPACSERTANPENCVVQDGPPRRPPIPALRRAPTGGGGATPPATSAPETGGGFAAVPRKK